MGSVPSFPCWIPVLNLLCGDCDPSPCLHGQCNTQFGGYLCACEAGWEGSDCDVNIDDCSPDPCHGHGDCTDLLNAFSCNCYCDWQGDECDVPIPLPPDWLLAPSDDDASNNYGASVAVSEDTVLIGKPFTGTNGRNGKVYVYSRCGTDWMDEQILAPSETCWCFGQSVALDQNRAVVGCPCGTPELAFVFERTGGIWTETAILEPMEGAEGRFGQVVALDGNTAVVAATDASPISVQSGNVHVFEYSSGAWVRAVVLAAGGAYDHFGSSIDLRKDLGLMVIGAPNQGQSYSPPGAAFIFVDNGATWVQSEAQLHVASGALENGKYFGASVAIHKHNSVLVGAPFKGSSVGDVYHFTFNGTQWLEHAKLVDNTGVRGSWNFGRSLAILGDVLVIGSPAGAAYPWSNDYDDYRAGAVHTFGWDAGMLAWQEDVENVYTANGDYLDQSGIGDEFGISLGMTERFLVVGAPSGSSGLAGRSYIYYLDPPQ